MKIRKVLHRASAMTLIETLLVLAIIGVLVGLSLAAVQQVRRSAARSGCSNQLRQIGLALNHHQAVHGIYPPQNPSLSGSEGSPYTHEGIGWTTYLLPFIEREDLWTKVRAAYAEDPDPWSAPHAGIRATVVKTYVCPADARLNAVLQDGDGWRGGFTSYVGMTGYTWKPKSGLFGRGVGVAPSAITDGLSHTVCVGERPPPASLSMGWWYTTHVYPNLMSATDFEVPADMGGAPGDPGCPGFRTRWPGEGVVVQHSFVPGSLLNECDKYHYWSLHDGGANFLFVDGSVRYLTHAVRFRLRFMATIDGGEPAEPD